MSSFSSFRLFAVTSLALLSGCGSDAASSSELEGVPELSSAEMALTGEPTSEGLATESDMVDAETLATDELAQADVPTATDAVDLAQLRDTVKDINASLRASLAPVVAMVRSEEPTSTAGALKVWGPVTRGTTDYRFLLRHSAAHRWGWRLEARLADTSDDYVRVAAGTIAVGAVARRGAGIMGFDFDNWATVDPTMTAQGQVLLGFKHGEAGTTVGYALKEFSAGTEEHTPVSALARAVHLSNGHNRLRLAYYGNVDGTATDAEELVLARARHTATLGGRSDLIATEGDVADGTALVISQCWDAELNSVFRIVRSCPLDGIDGDTCTVTESTGSNDACPAAMLAAEYAPTNPEGDMADNSDPNDTVAAPSEIPEVDGE